MRLSVKIVQISGTNVITKIAPTTTTTTIIINYKC